MQASELGQAELLPIVDTGGRSRNRCNIKDDIGGHAALPGRVPIGGQVLSVDLIGLAFGIEHGYIPEEILWGKAEGRTPLNDHPRQSAGMVVSGFSRMRVGLRQEMLFLGQQGRRLHLDC